MKIIGHATRGYLVEISKEELHRLCGQKAYTDRAWAFDGPSHPIGTTFDIAPVVDQVHALTAAAGNAKSGAGYLRALADQLEREIPKWICAPEEQTKP
jgi:hypothetical protein